MFLNKSRQSANPDARRPRPALLSCHLAVDGQQVDATEVADTLDAAGLADAGLLSVLLTSNGGRGNLRGRPPARL